MTEKIDRFLGLVGSSGGRVGDVGAGWTPGDVRPKQQRLFKVFKRP